MMKKSLVALAVLAVSGVASAQSNVTLYGLVDAWFGATKDGNLTQTGINNGGLAGSRFGLKGSEDLGGGLQANFLLEAGFDSSNGAADSYTNPFTGNESNAVFGRQSWLGVSGGFGELKLGKMFTPYDAVKGSGAGSFDSAFAPATSVWASNGYKDRPGNSVSYETPSLSGFTAAAMYSFGENKATTVKAGNITSFNVAYANGPVAASLAFQNEKTDGTATATKYTQLNGSYDLGVVKLLGAYGNVKNGLTPVSKVAADKTKEYQIGLEFPVSSTLKLSGGYARSTSTLPANDPELKRTGYGVAGLYDLSKRTSLYAGIQSGKETGGAAEHKVTSYGLGIRHTF